MYFKSRPKKSAYKRLETLAARICRRLFVSHKKVLTNVGYSDGGGGGRGERREMYAGSPEASARPKLSRTNSDSVTAANFAVSTAPEDDL